MKPKDVVYLSFKIRPLFYINLWCIKFTSFINAEKGYKAYEVMQERLEKNPELFIKIVKSK